MKTKILIIASILLIATAGIFIWAKTRLEHYVEDNNKTIQLAKDIQQYFGNGQSLEVYPFSSATANWGNSFLILENGGTGLSVRYNSDWNKKMKTEANYSGEGVKGLVIIGTEFKDLCDYVNNTGTKVAKATQRNYIISYFDMAKRTIVARDTVVGPLPGETKTSTASGMGDLPKDELVITTIRNKVKE